MNKKKKINKIKKKKKKKKKKKLMKIIIFIWTMISIIVMGTNFGTIYVFNASSLTGNRGAVAVDYDLDGNVDAFFSGSPQATFLRNLGGGVFMNITLPAFSTGFFNFDTSDFNNDGYPDILFGGRAIAYNAQNLVVTMTATGATC